MAAFLSFITFYFRTDGKITEIFFDENHMFYIFYTITDSSKLEIRDTFAYGTKHARASRKSGRLSRPYKYAG